MLPGFRVKFGNKLRLKRCPSPRTCAAPGADGKVSALRYPGRSPCRRSYPSDRLFFSTECYDASRFFTGSTQVVCSMRFLVQISRWMQRIPRFREVMISTPLLRHCFSNFFHPPLPSFKMVGFFSTAISNEGQLFMDQQRPFVRQGFMWNCWMQLIPRPGNEMRASSTSFSFGFFSYGQKKFDWPDPTNDMF